MSPPMALVLIVAILSAMVAVITIADLRRVPRNHRIGPDKGGHNPPMDDADRTRRARTTPPAPMHIQKWRNDRAAPRARDCRNVEPDRAGDRPNGKS